MKQKKSRLSKEDFPLSLKIRNLGKIKKECKFLTDIKIKKNDNTELKQETNTNYSDISGWESEIQGVNCIEELTKNPKIDEVFLVCNN